MNAAFFKEVSLSDQHKEQVQEFLDCWQDMMLKSAPIDLSVGQILFYQDHNPCGAYILTSGKIELYQKKGEQKQIIGHMKLNYPIGIDLIDHDLPYPYTAEVIEPTKGFFISKSDIASCLKIHHISSDSASGSIIP